MTGRTDPDQELQRHVERLLAERVAQGLPRHVEDPDTLARVAVLLREAPKASTDCRRGGGVL